MVDFEKIGRRIREERKLVKRVSQEQMALDLGFYQADISNLEKAKSGSGIGDLYKLGLIADYFEIPLEALIFGMEEDKMVHYYGDKVQLKAVKDPTFSKSMKQRLCGYSGEKDICKYTQVWECGPYNIYVLPERQKIWCSGSFGSGKYSVSDFSLFKKHCYIMMGEEIMGVMVFSITTPTAMAYQPAFEEYQSFLRDSSLDANDLLRVLNPYQVLYRLSPDEEKAQYQMPCLKRADAIRMLDPMPVVLIESVYIREDCRQHGMFRMCLDLIKQIIPGESILWLNLEPTDGEEMENPAGYYPEYSNSDFGQISMNAAIAEKMGFIIDSKIEKREVEQEDDEGFSTISLVNVRRSAYLFPKAVRDMIRTDHDLASLAIAKETVMDKGSAEGFKPVSRRTGRIENYIVISQQEIGCGKDQGQEHWIYVAETEDFKHFRCGVAPFDPFEKGFNFPGHIDKFIDESYGDSEYSDEFGSLQDLLDEFLNARETQKMLKEHPELLEKPAEFQQAMDKRMNKPESLKSSPYFSELLDSMTNNPKHVKEMMSDPNVYGKLTNDPEFLDKMWSDPDFLDNMMKYMDL